MLPSVAAFLRSHLDDDYDPRDADSGPREALPTSTYQDPDTLNQQPLPPQEPSYQDPTTNGTISTPIPSNSAPIEPTYTIQDGRTTPPTPQGQWSPVQTVPKPDTQAANPRMTYGRPFTPGMEEGPADPAPPPSGPPSMGDLLIQSRGGAPELADRSTEAQQRAVQQAAGGPVAPRQAPVYRQEPAEDAAAQIERQPAYEQPRGIPTLPGSSGRMLSEAARESNKTGQPIGPLSIYSAFSELPFDVYQAAHDRAVIAADRGLEGTDPLAPFRGLGIPLPSAEEVNPEGRPASVVLSGMLLAGVIPDPSDPYVAAAFKGAGKVLGAARRRVAGEVGTIRSVAGMAGERVGAALDANAERVAAADARMARQGSTVAPGTLGVISNNDPAQAMRGRVVPPEVADTLDFPVRIPEDPAAVRAIEAIGGTIDPERGVTFNVTRAQGPQAAGGVATRGSVFYEAVPEGGRSSFVRGSDDPTQVGGSQVIPATRTRFRSPLIVDDAPGSNQGFDAAMEQVGGKAAAADSAAIEHARVMLEEAIQQRALAYRSPDGSFNGMSKYGHDLNVRNAQQEYDGLTGSSITASEVDRAVRQARQAGPEGSPARAEALKEVVRRFGGDPDLIDPLLAVRGADASESVWAIRENILAAHARRNGYDGVITVEPKRLTYADLEEHPAVQAAAAAETAAAEELLAAQREANAISASARRIRGPLDQTAPTQAEIKQAVDREIAAGRAWQAAQEASASARDQARKELATGKITELADVREARNPTPGDRNPKIAELEQQVEAARQAEDAAYGRRNDVLQKWYTDNPNEPTSANFHASPEGAALSEDLAQLAQEHDRLREALRAARENEPPYTGTPGYTLREDIPRRAGAPDVPTSTVRDLPIIQARERIPQIQQRLDSLYQQASEAQQKFGPDSPQAKALWQQADDLYGELQKAQDIVGGKSVTASGTTGISRAGASALTDVSNSIGGGVFGATTGAALPADSDEQRRQNALTGAAVGMVAGPAAGRVMGRAGGALVAPGVGPNGRRLRLRELPEGAQAIKATDAAEVGRLRLDKFPAEVRDLIEQGAKEQDWARVQRRGVMPDDVVQARSMDDAASVDHLIKKGKAGRAYNAEETVAIRNAVASQSEMVRSLTDEIADARSNGMTPDLLIARRAAEATRLNGLIQVAEGARAEAGRTLRQYRQQARLIEMNPNQAVEQIYKKLGGRENAGTAVNEYTKMVKDGANPIQLAKFWAKVESGQITGGDLFALYRRFNMLSGPRTIEVNALSGLVNLGYEVVGAGIGQAARGRFGDAASEVIAPLKASKRAFQNMAETMWHGVSEEQALRGDIPRNLSSRTDNKAAKAALTVMEVPDRFNSGVDQFFRTMTEDWAATRLANKQARAAGLTPSSAGWSEAVAKNLETIRDDVSKFPEIKQMADRVTFSEEPGGIVKWLEEGKRKYPNIVGFVMPFIRTPANIASRAVDLSPIGPVRNAIEAGMGLGRGREMLPERLRDNAIGVGATLWAYDQAAQGNITGAGPDDPEKLAELRATGWQPYSIKIGDRYWSYANFAPFSLALSTGAAAHEAQKYAKPEKTDALSMLADGANRTGKVVTDMTVLAGIGAVIKSIQDPERYGGRWLSQSLQQLMPAGSLVNTIGQATDDVQRRAERDTFANQVTGDLKSRVPGLRQTVPAAQDPLGRAVPNEQSGFAALNPFRPTTERPNETIQQFIDAGVDIGAPKDKLTVRAGTASIELTPAEQRRWNELRGEQLTAMSPRLNASPGYQAANKAGREVVMKRVLNQASEMADRLLIGEIGTPEIGRRMRESAAKKAS